MTLNDKALGLSGTEGLGQQYNARANHTLIPISVDEVVALFGPLSEGENVVLCSFSGDPDIHCAWRAECHPPRKPMRGDHNCYFCLGTHRRDGEGALRNTKETLVALCGLVIDDVGTKVDPARLPPPTMRVETSPGNFQYVYIFTVPITDIATIEALDRAVRAAGLTDPGASGLGTRWGRLPWGINGKPKHDRFACVGEIHPERRYTLEELTRLLGISLDHVDRATLGSVPAPCTDAEFARVEEAMKFIPPERRHDYLPVLMALHSTQHLRAKRVAIAWARETLENNFDHRSFERDWASFKPGGGVGLGTLFHLARANGWAEVATADEFDSARGTQPSGVVHRSFDSINAEPIRWLWDGVIARGKLTVFGGNPGLGKSQVLVDIASRVTRGSQWPASSDFAPRGRVLILSAEDAADDTIKPRLLAAGADVSMVHEVQGVHRSTGDAWFNLARDLAALESTAVELGDVVLIIVDPISAYLGETDSHKNAEVRSILGPVGALATKLGAAVIANTHLNKGDGDPLARFTGSIAFVATARAAYAFAKDKDDPQRRLFLPAKNNLAADAAGFAYRIEPAEVEGGIRTSKVVWEDERVGITAEDAIARDKVVGAPRSTPAVGAARAFLLKALAGGSCAVTQIKADAQGAGVAWRTIERAKPLLGVEASKDSEGWKWSLPADPFNDLDMVDQHSTPPTDSSDGGRGGLGGLSTPPRPPRPPRGESVGGVGEVPPGSVESAKSDAFECLLCGGDHAEVGCPTLPAEASS